MDSTSIKSAGSWSGFLTTKNLLIGLTVLAIVGVVLGVLLSRKNDNNCKPNCINKVCGDDSCGGSCGTCSSGSHCDTGKCIADGCKPDCSGKVCGDDSCGGSCGTCSFGSHCDTGKCISDGCKPDCSGKVCGDDSCGGSCGTCSSGSHCDNGKCMADPVKNYQCTINGCVSSNCEEVGDSNCYNDEKTCQTSCTLTLCNSVYPNGVCNDSNRMCRNGTCICKDSCDGKQCGMNNCGESCGTCSEGQVCGTTNTDVDKCITSWSPKCVQNDGNWYIKLWGKVPGDNTWGSNQTCLTNGDFGACRWIGSNEDCNSEMNYVLPGDKNIINSDSGGPRCQLNQNPRGGDGGDDPWHDVTGKWWIHTSGNFNNSNIAAYNPPVPESGTCAGDNSCYFYDSQEDCNNAINNLIYSP